MMLTVDALLRTRGDTVRQRIDDLQKLSSAVGHPFEERQGTIAFATATVIGNLRLLLGEIRGNRPWVLIVGLSRSLVAALGTAAFGITSPVIWRLANTMHAPRMALLMIFSLCAIGLTLMAAHSLWERAPTRVARSRVVLINVATSWTVAIGVATTYVALLAINYVFGKALIPEQVLQHELSSSVARVHYLRIAWLVSSLATLGGALGAVLESNAAVRAAAYCIRPVPRENHVVAPVDENAAARGIAASSP